MGPRLIGQPTAAFLLIMLAGGTNVLRDVVLAGLTLVGIHVAIYPAISAWP